MLGAGEHRLSFCAETAFNDGFMNEKRTISYLSTNAPGPQMGMGHYERLIAEGLRQRQEANKNFHFNVTYDGRQRHPLDPDAVAKLGFVRARYLGISTARLSGLPWALARLASRWLVDEQPALFHSLDLRFPVPGNAPGIYTVHDLPPARFEDEGHLPRWAKEAAASASLIITPSKFAKQEIVALLDVSPEMVEVVPNGCEVEVFHPMVEPLSSADLQTLGLAQRFVVYVGGVTRRKNVAALLRAWPWIRKSFPDLTLGLVGPEAGLRALSADAGDPEGVSVVGYADRSLLPRLMRGAEALVYPSIYEGFGLPPLEALASGTPVVAVHQGAVPEVVADLATLAPDGSPNALADAVRESLGDSAKRERVRLEGPTHAAGFSWDRHAARLLEIYIQMTGWPADRSGEHLCRG